MLKYKNMPHTSDLRIMAWGKTLKELFENAAEGMFSLCFDLGKIRKTEHLEINIEGDEPEEMLINMLREFLFLVNARDMAFKSVSLDADPAEGIRAVASGEKFSEERHERKHEVKAVTYHALKIGKTDEGLRANVVFDV